MSRYHMNHDGLMTNTQLQQLRLGLAARSELATYRLSIVDKRGASYNKIAVFKGPLACMAWVRAQGFHECKITPLV